MKIIGIYKITSPTGRIYIGQSIDITSRFNRCYKVLRCKDQRLLYYSLLKYGYEKHKFEIIHIIKNKDSYSIRKKLNSLEKLYIRKYNSFVGYNKHGLNLTKGGDSYEISEQTRKILCKVNKGKKNGFYNKKHTEESKLKMSKPRSEEAKIKMREAKKGKNKGKNNPNYGNKWNKKQRDRMSNQRKGLKRSKEVIEKHRKLLKGRKHKKNHIDKRVKSRIKNHKNPISVINKNGKFFIFKSPAYMIRRFGLNPCCVSECLKGTQKTTKGWNNFKYVK